MKPLKSQVNWMEGYANSPVLQVLVDKIPDMSNAIYLHHPDGLYFAEKDGYVRFFSYKGPGQGYAGRCFPIRVALGNGRLEQEVAMRAGRYKEEVLVGPWSSRAGVMNMYGFTPCMEISITDDPGVMKRGYTFYGAAVTLEFAKEAVKQSGMNLNLVRCEHDREFTFEVMKLPVDHLNQMEIVV